MDYLEEAKKEIFKWFVEESKQPGGVMMKGHQIYLSRIKIKNPNVFEKFDEAVQILIDDGLLTLNEKEELVLTDQGHNSKYYTS